MDRISHWKRIFWIILVLAATLPSGCDPIHYARWDVDLNATPHTPRDARLQVNLPDGRYRAAMEKIDAFAAAHQMKRDKRDQDSLFHAYYFHSAILEAHIDRDRQVLSVRVSEFGTVIASNAYRHIKNALFEALKNEFPRGTVKSNPQDYEGRVYYRRRLVAKLVDRGLYLVSSHRPIKNPKFSAAFELISHIASAHKMVMMRLHNMYAPELPSQIYSGGEVLSVNPFQPERAVQMDATACRDGTLSIEFTAYTPDGADLAAVLYRGVKRAMADRFGKQSIKQS